MRRIIVILILGLILFFVGSRLLKKKPLQKVARETQEVVKGTSRSAKKAGKRAGSLEKREKKTKEERRKERELRSLERKRLREEKKRQRQLQQLKKVKKSKQKRGTPGMYILQAIVIVENTPYALIDGKQYKVGDEIMGRRIAKIESDKIILDYFGEITTVKVGEGCLPLTTLKTTRRK